MVVRSSAFVIANSGWVKTQSVKSIYMAFCMIVSVLPIVGCHSRSIVIDKEVLIQDSIMDPHAITMTSQGNYVVAGELDTAIAIGVDHNGALLWRYADPLDKSIVTRTPAVPQSKYTGVAALAGGSVILCGATFTKDGYEIAQVTILNKLGVVVNKQTKMPPGDRRFRSSKFTKCFSKENGVVFVGDADDGSVGYVWIIKLDKDGLIVWQDVYSPSDTLKPVNASASDIVIPLASPQFGESVVTTIELGGGIVAKRSIKGFFLTQLRTTESLDQNWILSYGNPGVVILYQLDKSLENAAEPRHIPAFDAAQGTGYILENKSIALFGRTANPAVAWISTSGDSILIKDLDKTYTSYVIDDATQIAPNKFVAVRRSVNTDASLQGVVLSWVSFN